MLGWHSMIHEPCGGCATVALEKEYVCRLLNGIFHGGVLSGTLPGSRSIRQRFGEVGVLLARYSSCPTSFLKGKDPPPRWACSRSKAGLAWAMSLSLMPD